MIKRLFPNAKVVKKINDTTKYCLGDIKASEILKILSENSEFAEKKVDWSISNSSLEEIFLEVVTKF